MNTPNNPSTVAPPWPHCGHGASPTDDPTGCRGVVIPGSSGCFYHASFAERDAYLTTLTAGSDIDHRGTFFTPQFLGRLLGAIRRPGGGGPLFGIANFAEAHFSEDAEFGNARFSGPANFSRASFTGQARFGNTAFSVSAHFEGAHFKETALFGKSSFSGVARFNKSQFANAAIFHEAKFSVKADFGRSEFLGPARFSKADFHHDGRFSKATFRGSSDFSNAKFAVDAIFFETEFCSTAAFDRVQFKNLTVFEQAKFSGTARFRDATFSNRATFNNAKFSGKVELTGSQFTGVAKFSGVSFSGDTSFRRVTFSDDADFESARSVAAVHFSDALFAGTAEFGKAHFENETRFSNAKFKGLARFGSTEFSGNAWFDATRFKAAWFGNAIFSTVTRFGPIVSEQIVDLSGTEFHKPVTLEISAAEVRCIRTIWASTATLRLRYAKVDLSNAVLSAPLAVLHYTRPFVNSKGPVDERPLAGDSRVRVTTVRGVDAAQLVLNDVDLTACEFSGSFHLDQIRIEGDCNFAGTPQGIHLRYKVFPYWWTRRHTLTEEHYWRATVARQPAVTPSAQLRKMWSPGPNHPDLSLTPDPKVISANYRQLRKALEDGKNEPGAADFYYGEMEMRRHDRIGTPLSERLLLQAYWLLSGYGLRASRAVAWLLISMTATMIALMCWGLPDEAPEMRINGSLTKSSQISLATTSPDPTLDGAWHKRFTGARVEKSVRVVVNSVVFRSSGQNLTTWGTYIEMITRLIEPVLLALGVLAIRGRIKR
ncbi:pentapeptide repeat-containing protein [Streptomyces sp. FR-108]|uniref:pentapeptide repeat-containing protein n=1 Tax=Streptomyces sp. FR-108 TaxID=3416665 RepID=UPI003CF7388F